jgi:putative FmdB family regulatory protein
MPNYEYLCQKCGHRFEQIRKFSDRQLRKCPECGGVIEQVISAPAVQFKGSGWYVTDYPKKGAGSAGSSSSASSDGDSSSAELKEAKDSKDTKASKGTKKDEKPKSDTSHKKQKKD